MKKIVLLFGIMIFFLSGCTNVNNLNYDEITKTLEEKSNKSNIYRTGYKYYLPRDMEIEDSSEFNEVLNNGVETFYLYVDALSYMNKIQNNYQTNKGSYYSKSIKYGEKFGYLEINLQENDKYLIEIMYNYAKIEVMVDKQNINRVLINCTTILRSIKFNEHIINNLFGEDILNFAEEEFNIFNTTSNDSTYIQIDNTYPEVKEELPDTDLIRKVK